MARKAPQQSDLFGAPPKAHRVPKLRGRTTTRANGYAAMPGTGPEGETCGSCANCRGHTTRADRTFYKCALQVNAWTHGRGSDVLLRAPACSRWAEGAPRETSITPFQPDPH